MIKTNAKNSYLDRRARSLNAVRISGSSWFACLPGSADVPSAAGWKPALRPSNVFSCTKLNSIGRSLLPALLIQALCLSPALAYPQFQEYVEKKSHQPINCAMCHQNGNGPEGQSEGQIGGLSEEEIKRLNFARAAFEPGSKINSPILNKFGNKIVKALGRKKVLSLVREPDKLYEALPADSDIDEDGVSDRDEYIDGTDPTNEFHADPLKLFMINILRYKLHIILAAIAIFSINFGLGHLIKGVSLLTEKKD